jgi:hypothetical protein
MLRGVSSNYAVKRTKIYLSEGVSSKFQLTASRLPLIAVEYPVGVFVCHRGAGYEVYLASAHEAVGLPVSKATYELPTCCMVE